MKIVGFGDSFILGPPFAVPAITQTYQALLSKKYGSYPEFRGISGTGPWHAFFDFLNYFKVVNEKVDVVIMAWSEAHRLYNPRATQFEAENAARAANDPKITYQDVFLAMDKYQQFVYDSGKLNYELKALMTMFDDMTLEYPNTKFINLHCFSWLNQGEFLNGHTDVNQIKYHYRFKNSMEIRPALIYLSRLEDWPGDENMHLETRDCHLSLRMHGLLANAIMNCIDNYQPGKLVNVI